MTPSANLDPTLQPYERRRYRLELAALHFGLAAYDLIHTQDVIASRALARVRPLGVAHVAKLAGSLVTEVESFLGARFNEKYRAYFVREEFLGATSSHQTTVASAALRRQLEELSGVPAGRVRVVPLGVDIDRLRAEAHEGGFGGKRTQRVVLLCPARLVAIKGHPFLLAAVALLTRTGRDVELWLAGAGSAEPSLRQAASQLGIANRVRFLGYRTDVPALMRQCDIVVLASAQETFSFALVEAQALGRAVVATRACGIPEAVEDGVTAMLCRPCDAEDLARTLAPLVDDPALRERMGAQGALHARRRFAVDRFAKDMMDVYRDALQAAAAEARTAVQSGGKARELRYPAIPDPDFGDLAKPD